MSDVENPWQTPQSDSVPQKITQGALTSTMLRYLKEAAPWLRFIGILGFIGCGLLALGGIIMLFAAGAINQVWSEAWEGFPQLGAYSGVLSAVFGASMTVYFLFFAVICFFPALFVYNFGSKIRSYMQSASDDDLEAAFKNNKSLWKFFGILAIIQLAFIPVMVIAGIIIAVAVAFGG
ncbi:MAG: hypothetical protein LBD48_06180 [Treponema sp.]|jgi:hypothetical protein|nr:hypothetical protein [Treponema sp.]